jgi:hypothetical protein
MKLTKYGDYERRVNFHVFGYAVFVVFTTDMVRSITSRYPDIKVKPTFEAMHCREAGYPYSHLFFQIGNCTNGTIAHESWHVIRFMLADWCNVGLDNENVAYHIGYLVDSVTLFRNDLIDKGIGVKSSKQEVPHERQSSQGTTTGVPSVLSRFERAGETGTLPDSPSPQNSGSDSGHCCP